MGRRVPAYGIDRACTRDVRAASMAGHGPNADTINCYLLWERDRGGAHIGALAGRCLPLAVAVPPDAAGGRVVHASIRMRDH